ncbi:MAG: tRNA (guanosine(46)-N7)-methyltransferase TrmB [Gammaproteobacteria bacterium]|nr:tRNA (guanosine(46)-N7)-methyltransferase TrmB [Gammaproteobacteria bacterium]
MNFPELSGGPHRSIRSYELRQGRLTRGQRRALELHWHEYGVNAPPGMLELDRIFGRRAPRVLDVGSGMGESTAAIADQHPENDYLAIEVHLPGIGALIRRAVLARLRNLRVLRADAKDVICNRLAPASLDEAWILFPDPWVKRRQHKRRLINPELVRALALCLKPNGRLFLATDWEDLAGHMRAICDGEPGLQNLAGTGHFAPRPAWRPLTKFEQRGLRLGHPTFDLAYART